MLIAVGVAARAAQRTLTRDFDRKVRTIATQDAAPGGHNLARPNAPLRIHAFHYQALCYSVWRCLLLPVSPKLSAADRNFMVGASSPSNRSTRTRASST